MGASPGELSEELVTQEKRKKGWRMNCEVGEATESLENEQSSQLQPEQSSFSNLSITSPTSQLIVQPFCCFTYVTALCPTLPSLHLRHSSFSNPSIALPMSQLIIQSFHRFSYVTGSSLMSPGEPPMHFSNVQIQIASKSAYKIKWLHFQYEPGGSSRKAFVYFLDTQIMTNDRLEPVNVNGTPLEYVSDYTYLRQNKWRCSRNVCSQYYYMAAKHGH